MPVSVLTSRLAPAGPSGFSYRSTAEEVTAGIDLSGQTLLVTGVSSGIGRETLRVLALRGARVIGTARSLASAEAAGAGMSPEPLGLACDLADPDSIRTCVARIRELGLRLDAIVCNAGIMALPRLEQAFGYEKQFFTNHVGHFLLVSELLGQLTEDARVVVVSSSAHRRTPKGGIDFDNLSGERAYSPWLAYGRSKLCNLLFARELARRLPHPKQRANALHPGVIPTNLTRHLPGWARAGFRLLSPLGLKTVPQGAATQCYLAARRDIPHNGEYFASSNLAVSSPLGRDAALAARLWETTERIVRDL